MSQNKKPLLAVAALSSSLLMPLGHAAPASAAAPALTARDLHAARCVAALEVLAHGLARDVKAGDTAARPVLLDRLTAVAAFIGDAYLRGTTDEAQAKLARQQALQAQKSLSSTDLESRQQACAREGAGLFASANAVQQYVVRRTAQRRMEKMLADPPSVQATPRRDP